MNYYLKPSFEDAQRLNAILYRYYVTEDGVNFKPPYNDDTIEFLDYQAPVFLINGKTLSAVNYEGIPVLDRDFITGLLLFKKDLDEAKAAGWIVGSD